MTPQVILYLDSSERVHAQAPSSTGARFKVLEPPEGVKLMDLATSPQFLRAIMSCLLDQQAQESRISRFPAGATTWKSKEEQRRASGARATRDLLQEGAVKVRMIRSKGSPAGRSKKSLAELGLA